MTGEKQGQEIDIPKNESGELEVYKAPRVSGFVNGKYVAKGEVVVIEESFGVRITEIVNSNVQPQQ